MKKSIVFLSFFVLSFILSFLLSLGITHNVEVGEEIELVGGGTFRFTSQKQVNPINGGTFRTLEVSDDVDIFNLSEEALKQILYYNRNVPR